MKLRDIVAEAAKAVKGPTVNLVKITEKLKAGGTDQWPSPGSGRFRTVRPTERHLTNVLLAWAGNAPVRSVENATRLRGLRIEHIVRLGPGNLAQQQQYFGGEMAAPMEIEGLKIFREFGEVIDTLIANAEAGNMPACPFLVRIVTDSPIFEATIDIFSAAGHYRVWFTGMHLLTVEEGQRLGDSEATVSREAVLWPGVFRRLGQILAAASPDAAIPSGPDGPATTPPSGSRSSSDAASMVDGSENVKAAEVGASTAYTHGQPTQRQAQPLNTAQLTEEEAGKQFPADVWADFPLIGKDRRNATPRGSGTHQRVAA